MNYHDHIEITATDTADVWTVKVPGHVLTVKAYRKGQSCWAKIDGYVTFRGDDLQSAIVAAVENYVLATA